MTIISLYIYTLDYLYTRCMCYSHVYNFRKNVQRKDDLVVNYRKLLEDNGLSPIASQLFMKKKIAGIK